jgi:hypothetical protein
MLLRVIANSPLCFQRSFVVVSEWYESNKEYSYNIRLFVSGSFEGSDVNIFKCYPPPRF